VLDKRHMRHLRRKDVNEPSFTQQFTAKHNHCSRIGDFVWLVFNVTPTQTVNFETSCPMDGLIDCVFNGTSTHKGKFPTIAAEGNWLGRLRMAIGQRDTMHNA